MRIEELDYKYPLELVAVEPARPSRVAFVPAVGPPRETDLAGLIAEFHPGDLLVINDTKVMPARVFTSDETEVLFLRSFDPNHWEVLFPAREFAVGDTLSLPGDLTLTLTKKGLPQRVHVSRPVDAAYFGDHGELALPPYIQQARGERHNRARDREWYQTAWASHLGSVAAPTASLHFSNAHLDQLRARGVEIAPVTLHVGAGTFLPVRAARLEDHVMHDEWAEIPAETAAKVDAAKERGRRVWALGTTVTRTLESQAAGRLAKHCDGLFYGPTGLFIHPPYEFQVVDALLTNFHQPKSTLLALVTAFAGTERVKSVYTWAIDHKFRLFSYGDLSAWIKS